MLSSGITIGDKDFTIDGWFYMINFTSWGSIFCFFDILNNNTNRLELTQYSNVFYLSVAGDAYSTVVSTSIVPITRNNWYHFAVVYQHSLSTIGVYLNGKLVVTRSDYVRDRHTYSNLWLGKHEHLGNSSFYGYIDEFRVSDGIAGWISDFDISNLN